MFGIEVAELAALTDRMCAATRAENQAAGARLVAIGDLDVLILRARGQEETWCSDTAAAIAVEIGAALKISRHAAESYLCHARALRRRLPQVGALLTAGELSYGNFKTIVYRTDLITDPDILAKVDATLAARIHRWPGITRGWLAGYVDKIVTQVDQDAVRQRHTDRELSIFGNSDGVTEVFGRLFTPDAHVLDARLDALANTVCPDDPRTHKQRRADALGALAGGAERLACRCGHPDCAAATAVAKPVLIHIIAEQATLDGTSQIPGSLIGADALIPAELIADLAGMVRLHPLHLPIAAPPESGSPPQAGGTPTPSAKLADFIRCRDLTCRFPGCDEPAITCDIDHTRPHAQGGPTRPRSGVADLPPGIGRLSKRPDGQIRLRYRDFRRGCSRPPPRTDPPCRDDQARHYRSPIKHPVAVSSPPGGSALHLSRKFRS
ncbi:MAG TPA: HNH endonuclease signature motif containing protein [Mycobacterium sp.]|nr:HNH endonuclease signature motif containing protein [Mycobacterium sp.]